MKLYGMVPDYISSITVFAIVESYEHKISSHFVGKLRGVNHWCALIWQYCENDFKSQHCITLSPTQNGRHFSDDISIAFSWMNIIVFWFTIDWNLFPIVYWTKRHQWFRYTLVHNRLAGIICTKDGPVHWHVYESFGLWVVSCWIGSAMAMSNRTIPLC